MSSRKAPFLRRAEDSIFVLSRILGIIAIIDLVAMMFFTVLDVFLRAFFNYPIPGDVELIELSMVCAGFFGLAWCAMRGMHIKVDLLVPLLPKGAQSLLDVFNYLLALGICGIFTWRGFVEGIANKEMNQLSSILKLPLFPFYWVMALGYAVLCLAILILLIKSVAEVIR
jgi:TRAP-type C4-dicarboxylate transport system permease small subunit